MSTSVNAASDPSRDRIIKTALRHLGVLNVEQEPDAGQLDYGSDALNDIVKDLVNDGVSVRVRERVTASLTSGASSISPGSDTDDVAKMIATDSSGYDRELGRLTMDEYQIISQKTIQAPPTQFLFSKENGTPLITLWPVNDGTVTSVTYTRIRRYRDMDEGDVTLDLPQNWHRAIAFRLAADMAPHFGMMDKAAGFDAKADMLAGKANMADTETGPLRFVPGDGLSFGRVS